MIFLKLGGSLITAKDQPETPRLSVLQRIADEIVSARNERGSLQLLIGHGSGSFGHTAAARHGFEKGVMAGDDWTGFSEVWGAARRLHNLVLDSLRAADLPAISIPPSASGIAEHGELTEMSAEPVRLLMEAGLIPVVYGDVVLDMNSGASIVSTEAVFAHLARALTPDRMLLAGSEAGVYADYPAREELLTELTPGQLSEFHLEGSEATDVTGGMEDKVRRLLNLIEELPELEAWIFSGLKPGSIHAALTGSPGGTRLTV
ncbi:MAG: isopentenyl phosphate kinase [Anaerolineales bacterium]|nr:isopentenyl phosphate kinase [Anaerolineales bacterium]